MEQGPSGIGDYTASQAPSAGRATRTCVSCGRVIDWHANVCPYCGHDYRAALQPTPAVAKSGKPIAAGILIILAGVLAIVMGVIYLSLGAADLEDAGYTPVSQGDISAEELQDIMGICGGIEFIFGAIAIIGGIFALMRKYFYFALVGGIFGLAGLGFLVGSLLGLIGIILIALSKEEFDQAVEREKKSEYHY